MSKQNSVIKILHIASGDLWAGAEVQLFTLAKALHDRPDITLEIVLLNHGRLEQELRSSGIQVRVVDEKKLNGMQILFQLVRILRQEKPDVVHTHRLKENILGAIAALIAGNIPSLRTVHGAPEHAPSWWQLPKQGIYWFDWLCGRFLQRKVVAVSGDMARVLEKRFPAKKIMVIENGVDLQAITERDTGRDTASKNNTFKIGIAGRLVPVKRLDIYIKTACYIREHYPELRAEFHIYGDGPLRNQLQQLSSSLQIDEAVFFQGHSDRMHEKLFGLDALLMTSDHEGLPMILLEAMASGTLIIAHAVGGVPVLLNHGECGLLIESNNESEYAEKIKVIVAAPELRNQIVTRALSRVKQFYSSQINAQNYSELYRSVVAPR